MGPALHHAAGRLASRQHGLITRSQALQLGFTASMIQHCRTTGRWLTIEYGVYVINGAPVTWHTKVLATCLALGAVASHRTAAVLLGVGGFRPGPVEVTVPHNTKRASSGSRVHESHDFGLIRPRLIEHIPMTPPARLCVDLGSVVSFERYEAAMDQLIGRGSLTWEEMFDTLMSHAKRGRNGVGALRALLDERYGAIVDESPLQQWFVRELRKRGFPTPETEHTILDHDGRFLARVDVAYPVPMVLVELDSVAFHLNRTSFTKDPRTRNRLRRLGWEVLEVTWDMLTTDPDEVFDHLAELIGQCPV